MESPHREVGLFTVRLLWERQRRSSRRPRSRRASTRRSGRRIASISAQDFVWPAARSDGTARLDTNQAAPERPWPASIGKRRLIEAIKTLALTDAGFAELVTPVLAEFRHSRPKRMATLRRRAECKFGGRIRRFEWICRWDR